MHTTNKKTDRRRQLRPFETNGIHYGTGPNGERICRGAMMGRRSIRPASPASAKLHLERVRLDAGGYDKGGAYWGFGSPLYCAHGEGVTLFVRANGREAAKAAVREELATATFLR